eukprot:1191051-Prorocentrum_minimum.AAC.6
MFSPVHHAIRFEIHFMWFAPYELQMSNFANCLPTISAVIHYSTRVCYRHLSLFIITASDVDSPPCSSVGDARIYNWTRTDTALARKKSDRVPRVGRGASFGGLCPVFRRVESQPNF